jgi:hypothetical protein
MLSQVSMGLVPLFPGHSPIAQTPLTKSGLSPSRISAFVGHGGAHKAMSAGFPKLTTEVDAVLSI